MPVTQPEDATATFHSDLYNYLDLLVHPVAPMAEVYPFRRGSRGKKLLSGAVEGEEVLRVVSSPPGARPYDPRFDRSCATHLSSPTHH